jgi:hypothetical protein
MRVLRQAKRLAPTAFPIARGGDVAAPAVIRP